MNAPDSTQSDLSFIRAAVQRQSRFQQSVFTPWFATMMGVCIFLLCLLKDVAIPASNVITQGIAWIIPAAAALLPWYELKRRGELPACSWKDVTTMILPWVVCGAAIFTFTWVAAGESFTPVESLQIGSVMIALTAILLGLQGSLTYLTTGIGIALGIVAMRLLPDFGWTAYGSFISLGLVSGALIEARK